MHAWEAIQKTVDYIEDHLGEEIEIETLAQIAALSPFYFQRLFLRLVKKPLREYIRLRRLAAASALLSGANQAADPLIRTKNMRILDVALETGFASHESFTRAFREAYGLTPEQFRAHPPPLNQFDKPDLLLGYTMVEEGVPLISEGLVLEYNRRTLAAPVRFLGFTGFAGAEVAPGAADDRFALWELPARDYIICGFEAENFEQLTTVAINKAVKYTGPWLERHGLSQELYSPEVYYDSSPAGSYMELWIPFIERAGPPRKITHRACL